MQADAVPVERGEGVLEPYPKLADYLVWIGKLFRAFVLR